MSWKSFVRQFIPRTNLTLLMCHSDRFATSGQSLHSLTSSRMIRHVFKAAVTLVMCSFPFHRVSLPPFHLEHMHCRPITSSIPSRGIIRRAEDVGQPKTRAVGQIRTRNSLASRHCANALSLLDRRV